MAKILIVEDEKPISELIRLSLGKAGHYCECVYNGEQAAEILETKAYDLILLNVMLPEINGFELMDEIRPLGIPVIFLTAKRSLEDRVASDSGVLYRKGSSAADFKDLNDAADGNHFASVCFEGTDGITYPQVSAGFEVADTKLYLNLGYDLSKLYETRAMQQQIFRRIYILMVILCAALAYLVSWLVTRPLSLLSKASREVASGNFAYRSGIRTGDEVGTLSADFDVMAEKVENSIRELQEAIERQEQFMGSFAHEMKTPMTSIIGYTELLRGQSLTPKEQTDAANFISSPKGSGSNGFPSNCWIFLSPTAANRC